jgi:hypothetical protein
MDAREGLLRMRGLVEEGYWLPRGADVQSMLCFEEHARSP